MRFNIFFDWQLLGTLQKRKREGVVGETVGFPTKLILKILINISVLYILYLWILVIPCPKLYLLKKLIP